MSRKHAWNRTRNSERKVAVKNILPKILIVSEGEKTEPLYFDGFRVPTVDLKIVPGSRIHVSVVRLAMRLKNKTAYDEVWCVFDRDKNPKNRRDLEQFNEAIRLAKANKIKIAYSNDAFELWYLLHFTYMKSAIGRHDYITKLNKYLIKKYEKNDPEMYDILEDRMDIAIRNARRLFDYYDKENPAHNDPCTTVFKLVERLKEFSR